MGHPSLGAGRIAQVAYFGALSAIREELGRETGHEVEEAEIGDCSKIRCSGRSAPASGSRAPRGLTTTSGVDPRESPGSCEPRAYRLILVFVPVVIFTAAAHGDQ